MPSMRPIDEELEEKYVVIRYDDWVSFCASNAPFNFPHPIHGDFFVVRESDVFAPQLLYGYAHVIQTFLEGLKAIGADVLSGDQHAYLADLADKCVAKAEAWQFKSKKKIPD